MTSRPLADAPALHHAAIRLGGREGVDSGSGREAAAAGGREPRSAPGFLPEFMRAMPPALLASSLMIAAFLCFSLMSVLMREVGHRVPVIQVVLVRQVIAFLLLAPWFWAARAQIRRPTGMRLHLARGLFAVGSMVCGLTAILLIPLADATAIQMAEVLFVTALAATILRERVGWRRWTATAVGFVGIFIMLKPFGGGFQPAALLALVGALFGACSMIALRLGSSHDGTAAVLFWQGVVVLAVAGPVASYVWTPVGWSEALLLGVMGVVFTMGLWLFTYALRLADASALAPLQYLRLVMMAVVGWALYGEVPTVATVVGGALVLGAAIYTIRRNAKVSVPLRPAEPTP